MEENISIGVKIHDAHHGLIQRSGAIIESEYAFLKELGAAIQIATTIKDHQTIKNLTSLYAAAGELKIPQALTKVGLKHLEQLGFVRLKYRTGKEIIERVDITVPDLPKVYQDFGDYFKSENESEICKQTINILEKLSAFPHKEKDIVSSLGISNADKNIIFDIGKASSLIDTYVSPNDSEKIVFSPLYWDDNPGAIFSLLEKHKSNEFIKAVNGIKDYQGLPEGKADDKIVADAIKLGCLPTLTVSSTSGPQKFIFTPKTGVGKVEKELLHKARVLISCVRYGENFAGITKIYSPVRLISALARNGFLGAHTESLKQYESARNLGLVKIIPYGTRYEVHFIDNDENKKVVSMAIEMLQLGDTSKLNESEDTARKILVPGNVLHPTQTRTHLLEENNFERSTDSVNKINDLLRGII